MGNKLFTSRSPSTDQGTNRGSENFEMHQYDIMSTATSAALRKSVECLAIQSYRIHTVKRVASPR